MENIMNYMENSPKTDFWLEPRAFEVKNKSASDLFFMTFESIEYFIPSTGMIRCLRAA
jgi:hypothetical protein